MTDSHLRELERRFRASGSVEDEAAWLRERVRVGELPEERLRLRLALSEDHWPLPQKIMYAFEPCGPESWRRAAIALAASVTPPLVNEHPDVWQPLAWLTRAENFVLERPVEPPVAFQFGPSEWDFEDERHRIDYEAYKEARRAFASEQAWHASSVLQLIPHLPEWTDVSEATGVLMTVLDGVDLQDALAALRAEVFPWLLGYSDPVRERVEARQREAAGE